MLYWVRERLKVTTALLTVASQALCSNYSLVAIAIGLSCVQIVWLGVCFLFVGLSFMSGQAVVAPKVAFSDSVGSARCMWQTDGWAYVGLLFIILMMLWTNSVLSDVKRFVISAGIALWYANPTAVAHGEGEIRRAWGSNSLMVLDWALSASFGTLCISSLVTVPAEVIRALLQPLPRDESMWGEGTFEADEEMEPPGCLDRLRAWHDGCCRSVWRALGLESLMGFVDRMAVPMVAITGYPFCHAAKTVSHVLACNDLG
eukprot:CAMPEP_0173445500 /NCGR_PEP_ID=MMETSP1357-20121228/34495_1 /TAXON_ID=77926 /ORGANISM="Hemiselmis rufescens, Strain PCC563" /LENGTH=258 /DNA_ID=CAMNT_0014411685 /DNA_START=1 /DNA_END=774 /DNA_ORIENTATION=-